jgi:hypothetical protein
MFWAQTRSLLWANTPPTAKALASPNFQHLIFQLVVIPEPALSLNDNQLLIRINEDYTADCYNIIKNILAGGDRRSEYKDQGLIAKMPVA